VAYRFLLEVPESRIDEANLEVGAAGDAQVVVVRSAHGLGFDTAGADLTIAAHTLGVISSLYSWYGGIAAPKPNVGIVLHSGQRLAFADHSHAEMVAAIRRDQPWVERTLPKIGDHARDVIPGASDSYAPARPSSLATDSGEPIRTPRRRLTFTSGEPVAVKVTELDRAEHYYVDFLGMSLLGRERFNDDGAAEPVERDYDPARALSLGTEADVSFLANGPVTMALRRVGRGARLERDDDGPIEVGVDRETYLSIKGDAFMRGMEIVHDSPEVLGVRDIYGLVWAFRQTAPVAALA
jgi:catechol 2,3-dioxygenase-like lactoylglutathione lyase family enzyme